MFSFDIVGGIYHEQCVFPYHNQFLGSAGRAAKALSGIDNCCVTLHSCASAKGRENINICFCEKDITLNLSSRPFEIIFYYVYTLSEPKLLTSSSISQIKMPDIEGDIVIKFGMLEADASIKARYGIYDPQSAVKPLFLHDSNSEVEHLAIVANKTEFLKMAKSDSIDEAVKAVIQFEDAEIAVVKNGIFGADVYYSGRREHIPAYRTSRVFKIGSGDVFVASFAYAWAALRKSPVEAANYASMRTAHYVEQPVFPVPFEPAKRVPAHPKGGTVYLAGPFRNIGQRMLIDDTLNCLSQLGMQVISPCHDIGIGSNPRMAEQDLSAIKKCDAIFAILGDGTLGTSSELGYARALNKPVFCAVQNSSEHDLLLPKGMKMFLYDDYVNALFQVAWRS